MTLKERIEYLQNELKEIAAMLDKGKPSNARRQHHEAQVRDLEATVAGLKTGLGKST